MTNVLHSPRHASPTQGVGAVGSQAELGNQMVQPVPRRLTGWKPVPRLPNTFRNRYKLAEHL